ncbi:PSD1 and planctomycete cytochrome C domain-containing protein [Novipirellula artificiosorum]|uniref:Planctomycete cytochrome C n=1 Tax=Novipirellula artificiosorum TaxID=2528016 RepID=A0A5C6DN34_9BACT|nr:PSD1 and planctomycete cytochrome C domain-containing protein [Novipirellula artificiosorum]TWU38250.1 Planctomycete cytochrome C [Novipirellula artificiosorum]
MTKLFLVLLLCLLASSAWGREPETLNFNRDIRPILSSKCFACHGPDSQDRDADYRLDTREGAFADLGGYAGIVPGEPDSSELVLRITSDDLDMRMPPPEHQNPLTTGEIDLLTDWIVDGAPYSGHWAFEAVGRPKPPVVDVATVGAIDLFIAARLKREGLAFSPEAAPETLVRRLHLDLMGLPPSTAELDAYLKDPKAEFEMTIDRLMESPQFAERLAMDWLDVARFADTNGYSIDDHRDMWAWRDWVIHAFQTHMPYDEFLRQQLAGDLMENATEGQKTATGFLRNSMNTHEGGTIAEEYRVAAIIDKVDTVSTTFMGLTMRCAQCHDHKYDPISQRDYYRFFAFFNTSTESGVGGTNGNTNPVLSVTPILQDKATFCASLESRIAALQHAKAYPQGPLGDAKQKWEKETLAQAAKAAFLALVASGDGRSFGTDANWMESSKAEVGWKRSGHVGGFTSALVVVPHGATPWGKVFARIGLARIARDQPALIAALRKPNQQRSTEEHNLVAVEFGKANSDMDKLLRSIDGEIGVLQTSLASGQTSVMVMNEGAADRKTPILRRGQYDQHGEIVEAGIPAVFGNLPESTRPNRLALADWLTDPIHPLTARVAVNRYWQLLFGTGLVKTSEDFGSQGEWPSHPELLDWLASEFVASGWDVRALLKTMLLSRTYRQVSDVSEELLKHDPYNRLYARAPRYRLSAEGIRDSALAIAGLLDREVGGPSVFPPQPLGLWKEVSHFGYPGFFSAQHYFPDRGERVYRRSLYTFWKRTSPPPFMTTFDAPNRETCVVRRSLTNTPLQALVMMNAPQFVEASRGLAEQMLSADASVHGQIRHGFRLATARHPSAQELAILNAAYQRQLDYFGASPKRTARYLVGSELGTDDEPSAAAICSVASLILNLDETITRQ